MQKNTSTVSDRLRGVLSDLSSFIGKDASSAALPACESRDRDLFFKRVRSFKSSSWFAKPRWLSPVSCARYGWMNVDVDLLQCVGCQSVLVVRSPSSFDPAIYDACQKRLEDQLKRGAHHACCTWPSCPVPETIILAHSGGSSRAVVVDDFLTKAMLLYSAGKDLPAVGHSSLDVSDSDVMALCSLVTNSPKFQHDAEVPGALQSAVLLALAGWDLSDGGKAVVPGCTSVQCTLCMRQPGLWNYVSITGGGDTEPGLEARSCGDSLSDIECNADEESESESQAAATHSTCVVVESRLSPYEVTDMQLAAGSSSSPAVTDDSLPFDVCMDVQESLVQTQDVEARDELPDRLLSIDSRDAEHHPVAVSPDQHDNSEALTNDMTDVADPDEDEHRSNPNAQESLSGFLPSQSKNSTSHPVREPQLHTDIAGNRLVSCENTNCDRLPCDLVQQERDTRDSDVREELDMNDSDGLDACPEFDNTSDHKETNINAADSGDEEMTSNSAGSLAAPDEHSHEPANPDKLNSSDSVEKDVDNSSNTPEDLSCTGTSSEPPISAVDNSGEMSEMACLEEVGNETETLVQCAEQNEDNVDTNSQESLQQSADVDSEAAALDLTVRLR